MSVLEKAIPVTVWLHPVVHKLYTAEAELTDNDIESYLSFKSNRDMLNYIYLKPLKNDVIEFTKAVIE